VTGPASPAAVRRHVRTVLNRLRKRYGDLLPPRRSDPLEELVLTVLSQHTSDVNAERSYAALRAAYETWADVVAAPPERIADTIRSGGLADTKAPRIQAILREVHDRRGAFDLSYLRDLPDEAARAELLSLPGVGPKTAAVVLSFSLDRDAMPVDTHVHRVTRRLGWIPPKTSAERADRILHELVPDGIRTELHVALIRHGRDTCKAPIPRCHLCVLKDICPTAPRYLGGGAELGRRSRSA
jgi:endonuclease-3